jgi:hypothetical protein
MEMTSHPSNLRPQPAIQLTIERLVLEGLPISQSQGALIQEAVETETARLLAEQALGHLSASAVPYLSANSIQVTRDTKPGQLGRQIAGTLIERIGNHKLNNKHKGN